MPQLFAEEIRMKNIVGIVENLQRDHATIGSRGIKRESNNEQISTAIKWSW